MVLNIAVHLISAEINMIYVPQFNEDKKTQINHNYKKKIFFLFKIQIESENTIPFTFPKLPLDLQ